MKISKINYNYRPITPKSFKENISPEYIGLISRKVSNVAMDVKSVNEKIDESKHKEDIIIQQNKDILTALYLMSAHTDISAYNKPWVQEIQKLAEKNYKF